MPRLIPAPASLGFRLDDYTSALAWSADGRYLAAGSLGGTTVVLAVEPDGDVIRAEPVAELPEHPLGVLALDWSSAGPRLASGGQDGRVRVWQPERGSTEVVAGSGWVQDVAWSPDGDLLAAAVGRDLVLVDGATVQRFGPHPSTVTALAWSTNGRSVGIGCYGGVWWYQPGAEAVHRTFEWKGSILTFATAPNGKWLASGNQDNSVHVWRLWSGDDLEMNGYESKVEHLAWDPASRWLCVGGIGDITCWDFSGRGPQGTRPKSLDGHTRRITALVFGGTTLASGSADGTVRFWKVPKRDPLAVTDLGEEVAQAAWRPGGGVLAVGGADGGIHLVRSPR